MPDDVHQYDNVPGSPFYEDVTDSDAFEDKKETIIAARMDDLNGWFLEGITEASCENLDELRGAIVAGNNLKAGELISGIIYRYITPSDADVIEELNPERD
jgi:hypothetical protein